MKNYCSFSKIIIAICFCAFMTGCDINESESVTKMDPVAQQIWALSKFNIINREDTVELIKLILNGGCTNKVQQYNPY